MHETTMELVLNLIKTAEKKDIKKIISELDNEILDNGYIYEDDCGDYDDLKDEYDDLKHQLDDSEQELDDLRNKSSFLIPTNLSDEDKIEILEKAYNKFNIFELQDIFSGKL